jgi:hypothetical protein
MFPTGKANEKTFAESFKKLFPTIEIDDISEYEFLYYDLILF